MTASQILVLLLPVALVLLLVNAQRRRTRQASALQDQLVPGAEVCTTSGLFGTVVTLTDREFILEAAPGVHLRFDRRAVGLVVPSNQPASRSSPPEDPEPDDSGGHDHPA